MTRPANPQFGMTGSVHVRHTDGIVAVQLHHPGKFNAMSRGMWQQLRQVFEEVQRTQAARVVLLSGEGGHFCAGGDISEYPAFRFEEASLREFHEVQVWGALQAMLDCDLPIVAQIEGNCMGAGLEIASCCDIRMSGESACFGAPIARLGFPMAPREAALLLRELGAATVRQVLLQAAVLSATEVKARGFLHEVLAGDLLHAAALKAAQHIASLAPQAARANKRTLRAFHQEYGRNRHFEPMDARHTAIDFVANDVSDAYRYAPDAEHREGIGAFLDKRKPDFNLL